MADGFQAVVQELQTQREEERREAARAENTFDKLPAQLHRAGRIY